MKTLLLLVGLLLTWENGPWVLGDKAISDKELQEMSTEGVSTLIKKLKMPSRR